MTDAEILDFRMRLTAMVQTDPGRNWSFNDTVVRYIDLCNRALGCGIHDGQVWRGAPVVSSDVYKTCQESRRMVEAFAADIEKAEPRSAPSLSHPHHQLGR